MWQLLVAAEDAVALRRGRPPPPPFSHPGAPMQKGISVFNQARRGSIDGAPVGQSSGTASITAFPETKVPRKVSCTPVATRRCLRVCVCVRACVRARVRACWGEMGVGVALLHLAASQSACACPPPPLSWPAALALQGLQAARGPQLSGLLLPPAEPSRLWAM